MAGIQTGIELQDNFTSVIMGIINSVNLAVSAMDSLDQSVSAGISTVAIQGARDEINEAAAAASQLSQEFMNLAAAPAIRPAKPVQWQSDVLTPVVDVSGMERYQQEVQRTGQMLDLLNSTQAGINQSAASMDMLPDAAVQDIEALGTRMDAIKDKIQEIADSPVIMGTEEASAQLEHLYGQLARLHQEQGRLSGAMESMDISDINSVYMKLSQTISSTERYLRDSMADTTPATPPPVQWQSDVLTPVVDVSGLERYQQEVQRTGQMLDLLNSTQAHISQSAREMDILPAAAVYDIETLGTRLGAIKDKIQQIENDPVTMGTDEASAQLEHLYGQLTRLHQGQENLDRAMESMDISDINSAYIKLSQTISGTERYIRDNTDTQDRFNQTVERCRAPAEQVKGSFKGWEKAIVVANNAIGLVENTLGRLGVLDISGAFDRIDTMNRFQRTVTTMTGDAGMADAALAQLKDTTVGTAYGLDVAGAAAQGFLTRGMSLGAATDQVRIWADAVSFYGEGTNEQLESVVDAIGKMYSKGSVEADQLDRLFDAGIGAAEIYAEAVGESVAKVKDDLSNKNISSAEFINTVSQVMDNGISHGAAKEAGDTWAATFSNVQSAVTRGWTGIIQSLDNELAANGLPSSMELVQSFGQTVENVLNSVAGSMDVVVGWGMRIADTLSTAGTFIADNWGIIAPVIGVITAAFIAYNGALLAYNVIGAISNTLQAIGAANAAFHAGATFGEAAAATTATGAQAGFNGALLACPLTWIVLLIMALIGVIIGLANHFSGAGHVAQSTFGAICGGVNVVIQFFKNLALSVANVALGIWEALKACAENVQTAFHNTGCNIKSFFYGLVSTVLTVIETICKALNKLPFVEFDYSGVSQAADNYAAKSAEAAAEKKEYASVGDAFKKGMGTYETFRDGWVDDAYREGAAWGDDITEKVKDFFLPERDDDPDDKEPEDYDPHALAEDTSLIAGNTDDTAKNTAKAANSLEITGEDLKYLRDMAEKDYVNKFTTAEIKVNMTNHNKIDKDMDIDGLSVKFCKKIEEELTSSAEGVH